MKYFLNTDVIWLESVDSTNEEIKRRITEFSKPTWIIAKKQNKGKGRNGNSWISSNGNFSGSIVFFPTVGRAYLHLYGFFVGVALYNTIKNMVKDGVDVRLKWPNDLMVENGKVAGILLETVQKKNNGAIGLVIGIGVNLNSSPSLKTSSTKRYNTEYVTKFTNDKVNQSIFFNNLNNELIKLCSYIEEKKLCSILKLWQSKSYKKGTTVYVSDNDGRIKKGTFLGLDDIGGLILGERSGVRKIYSGDIYFGS